ncbi:MAG: hypothetical protein KIT87_27305 [Anaerolineae bacterium]|nr:hypothetical protein [Anaerolineae bacterium]
MKRMLSLICGLLMTMLLMSAGFASTSQAAPITNDATADQQGMRKDLPPKCGINWKPSVLLPVSSHSEFFDASSGAPGPLQVFYPSLGRFADAPVTSLLDGCGQYPLVIFLHGHRIGDPNVYLRWTRLPSMLARSGYVVVVPRLPGVSSGSSPFQSADLDYAKTVLTWMQTQWTYHNALAPSPRPAIVGHSFGAILGARLAPQIGASAYVSLSAGWRLFDPHEQEALSDLTMPGLFAWGKNQDDFARLETDVAPLWPTIKTLKHKLVFEQGTHWDYLLQAELPGSNASEFGRCRLIPDLAAEYTALFLSRYAPPADTNIENFIPPSLVPPFPTRTDLQAALAAGQFQGLQGVRNALPECDFTHQLTEPTNPYGFQDATWPWLDRSAEYGTPDAEGSPTAVVIPGLNTYNIAYRDTSDHLRELWRDAVGTGTTDLTAYANAPKATGNPFAYVDTRRNTEILLYRDSGGTVHSLYWSTGAVGHDNLSGSAPGAPKAAGDPVGYYDADTDTHHVIYTSSNGHLHELWWAGVQPVQYGGDLTALAGAPTTIGTPSAFVGYDGFYSVIYRGGDGHIHRLFWKGSMPVGHEDLSGFAGAPPAKGDPVAYYTAHNQTHQIVYRGLNWHVWELSWQGNAPVTGWDIMAGLGDPSPDDKIAAFYSPGTNTKHVIFTTKLGTEYLVQEIRWTPGGAIRAYVNFWWAYGAPLAFEGPAGFAVESANTRHVTYRGHGNHIYEVLLR